MATSLGERPLCHQPRQVEARLHTIHLQWLEGQQTLKQAEQKLLALHQHERQLCMLVRDTSCGTAPALRAKLAWTLEQVALTQERMAQETHRCQELAAQFDAVQVALAVARRQARQRATRGIWAVLQRVGQRVCQGMKQAALLELSAWEQGRWF